MDSSSVIVVLSRNSGSSMPMGEGGETTRLCVERQRQSQFLLLRRVLVHVPSPTIPPHDAHPSRGWDPRSACGRCRRRPSNVLPLLVVVVVVVVVALVVVSLVVHRASHGIVVVVYPARCRHCPPSSTNCVRRRTSVCIRRHARELRVPVGGSRLRCRVWWEADVRAEELK